MIAAVLFWQAPAPPALLIELSVWLTITCSIFQIAESLSEASVLLSESDKTYSVQAFMLAKAFNPWHTSTAPPPSTARGSLCSAWSFCAWVPLNLLWLTHSFMKDLILQTLTSTSTVLNEEEHAS